jgi:hypothetical protein
VPTFSANLDTFAVSPPALIYACFAVYQSPPPLGSASPGLKPGREFLWIGHFVEYGVLYVGLKDGIGMMIMMMMTTAHLYMEVI